ncbi:hypothetical protein CGMCC3_g16633 [Colletotrichum fructicola]|nr:uncharacterized protein CGMCC3_g16633 [Colletotrichum fructicola]KAE9567214.1 hypothetical protein CGMCC3_g16633 [Colletotrichum fructicola]KAF4418576.1 hypothetical protein CFRS1_v015280 [Colletotrichum fructicola]KAF5482855.1 hypothetical protein CGCF413_v015525 [Colletotrichum fructicola]
METALSLVTHNEELDEAGEVAGGDLAHEREESNVNINSTLSHDDDKSEVGDGDPSLGGCVDCVQLERSAGPCGDMKSDPPLSNLSPWSSH